VCDVLNKYKAELAVSSSWWMKEMITVSAGISHAPLSHAHFKARVNRKATNGQASKLIYSYLNIRITLLV